MGLNATPPQATAHFQRLSLLFAPFFRVSKWNRFIFLWVSHCFVYFSASARDFPHSFSTVFLAHLFMRWQVLLLPLGLAGKRVYNLANPLRKYIKQLPMDLNKFTTVQVV